MGIRKKPSARSYSPPAGVGVRRTSYPSGPWVDANGHPAVSPNALADKDKEIKRLKKELEAPTPNPDPNNYKIVKAEEWGQYTILKINYPDCTNYEGNKIVVFKAKLLDLVNQRVIDPHFFEDEHIHSPIARFMPTDEGWDMAVALVHMLEQPDPDNPWHVGLKRAKKK